MLATVAVLTFRSRNARRRRTLIKNVDVLYSQIDEDRYHLLLMSRTWQSISPVPTSSYQFHTHSNSFPTICEKRCGYDDDCCCPNSSDCPGCDAMLCVYVTLQMHFEPKCIRAHPNAFGFWPKTKCIWAHPRCIRGCPKCIQST
jgi:hypothetical protein